jgi:hypothetical protein
MSKFKELTSTVTRKYGMQVLKAKKNSPAIMFGAGVVGVVATVVLASRATLQLESVVDETESNVQKAKHLWENGHEGQPFYKDEAEYNKDLTLAKTKGVINIAKLYAPAFIVGSLAVGCLTGAHVTLQRRNGALMLAYAGLEKAYKEYENRVRKELGDERAAQLKHDYEEVEIYSEGKKGEPIVERVKRVTGSTHPYGFMFGPHLSTWNPTPEYNVFFLKSQETYWNDYLQTHGYVLLNDVLSNLGMEKTSAGAVTGWVYGTDLPGDNYIDFGCWKDENMDKFHDFMVGREDSILLEFNVAGQVYELIDRIGK